MAHRITTDEIEPFVLTIYSNLNIDRPSNHDQVVEFIRKDVEETADPINWHSGDVEIAFRRFIEFQANNRHYTEPEEEEEEPTKERFFELIYDNFNSDDDSFEKKGDLILRQYEAASEDEKGVLNFLMVSITGYSIQSYINAWKAYADSDNVGNHYSTHPMFMTVKQKPQHK